MINVKDVIERTEIREALEFYGIEFKHNKAFCPFHQDKRPSLATKGTIYTCFACGEQGDVVNFVQKYFSLSFRSALKKINEDFDLNLSDGKLTEKERIEIVEDQKMAKAIKDAEEKIKQKDKFIYAYYSTKLKVLRMKANLTEVDEKLMMAIEADMDDFSGISLRRRWSEEV